MRVRDLFCWFTDLACSACLNLRDSLYLLPRRVCSYLLVQNGVLLDNYVLLAQVSFKLGFGFLVNSPYLSLESGQDWSVRREPIFIASPVMQKFENLLLLAKKYAV